MISKYFLLAFICVSLTQVQGDELENAVKKGLIKVEALYRRGIQRIDNVNGYDNEIIQTKTAAFIEKIRRMQESSRQTVRRVAQEAEEKATEMGKPQSVFECISKAEKNVNKQIDAIANKFQSDMEKLKKMYSSKLQTASRPLATYRKELESKYKKSVSEIKACKTTKCVETAVKNYSLYQEKFFEAVSGIQNQITTIVSDFRRELTTAFNNTNRQISTVKSDGLKQIRECVYRRDAFEKEQ